MNAVQFEVYMTVFLFNFVFCLYCIAFC